MFYSQNQFWNLMKKVFIIFIIYVFISDIVGAQPINMIEREMRYNADTIMNRYKRGEIDFNQTYDYRKEDNQIQSEDNSLVSNINSIEVESEVHAAINPIDSNNIVLSPIFQRDVEINPQLYCSIYFTKNGGDTWMLSKFRTPIYQYDNVRITGGGDPVLAFDNNGRVYLTWLYFFLNKSGTLHSALYWSYSDDGGDTWNEPKNPFISLYKSNNSEKIKLADKQWMTTNKNNDLFVSYTLIDQSEVGQSSSIQVAKLPTGKDKFDPPITISGAFVGLTQFSTITVDYNQHIHIMYAELRRNGDIILIHSKSTDSGKSFTNSNLVSEILLPKSILNQSGSLDTIIGITTRRLYPAPMLVADNHATSKYKNNLYAVWNANGIKNNEGRKMDIYFSKSTNGGNSWDNPKVLSREVNSRPVSQYYPSIAVNTDGIIAVSYYDRNEDVNRDTKTSYVIQYSYDGGISFTSPKKVSAFSTDFSQIGDNNNQFGVGEYNTLLLQKDFAMPVWADGREGDGKVRIYAAKVSLDTNGIEIIYSLNTLNKLTNAYFIDNNQLKLEKIFTKESEYSFIFYDLSGKKLLETEVKNGTLGVSNDIINLDNLISGVYFIQLKTDYGYSVVKFVKN